jgi:catechol 2,3-dioxygenase-like lactoylglutathione lyase family enzyme
VEGSVKLRHVALVYRSEENADRFLIGVLGLKRSEPKMLTRELCRSIFDEDREMMMAYYADDSLQFEVFIDARHPGKTRPVEHVCLEVEDMGAFLERCGREGVSIRRVPRSDSVLVFVSDADHNLFEIKEKKLGA